MCDFQKLEERYLTDPAFNKATTVFRRLIEDHGFMPSELRESLFMAQYMFEMTRAERVIRSDEEWGQLSEAREILKTKFAFKKDEESPAKTTLEKDGK